MDKLKSFLSSKGIAISCFVLIAISVLHAAIRETSQTVNQLVASNFVATGLLADLQMSAERMRRYEKEMFIYVADNKRRTKYVDEFDDAHKKLLTVSNTILGVLSTAFTREERVQVQAWMDDAIYYTNEFDKLARKASSSQTLFDSMPPEQQSKLTVEYNTAIGPGKDRFANLLKVTAALRAEKEKSSSLIGDDLREVFSNLSLGLLVGGAALVLIVLVALRISPKQQENTGASLGAVRGTA